MSFESLQAAVPTISETSLYRPVKAFLEARGLVVKGEICGCDIVAIGPGDSPLIVIAEMKLSVTLELILQAVDRLRAAQEVWLAVPATRRGRDQDPRVRRLCRFLGLGFLLVDLALNSVTVVTEPGPYKPRANPRMKKRLRNEHSARRGDPAVGGSSRAPVMTAYRQRALACVMALNDGPLRPRDLRDLAPDAGSILLRNVYGWFERNKPGVYQLTPAGRAALEHWRPQVIPEHGTAKLGDQSTCLTELPSVLEIMAPVGRRSAASKS